MYHFFIVIILSAFRPPEPEDPCEPNPCGPNSNPPYARGTQCQCTCQPQMIGSPPNCRPECVINNDCPSDKACINRKCEDPCPGLCGTNAYCRVRNHIPICVCNRGFNGDPFSRCNRVTSKSIQFKYFLYINQECPKIRGLDLTYQFNQLSVLQKLNSFSYVLAPPPQPEVIDPCNPSPCGINAECRDRNSAASCSCLPGLSGNPYIECKPECTINSECPDNLACIQQKCKDPCPGVCGQNAYCKVRNHNPSCICNSGFSGDPFTSCRRNTRKFLDITINWVQYI